VAVAIRVVRRPGQSPRNGNAEAHQDAWSALRAQIGARPAGVLTFPARRSRLADLLPGEKLLLIRKYGGLGDILICSMLFPDLQDQYPDIHVTFAPPQKYHPLFEGSGLTLQPYESVFQHLGQDARRGIARSEFLSGYDLIEDLSMPCHLWENFFVAHGGTEGGRGLRWRNRLDMWSRWFGLRVANPRTCIVLRAEEKAEARRHLRTLCGADRPVCLLAPFAANRTKSYPWFEDLARGLEADGWAVVLLHSKPVPGPTPAISGPPLRMMGAFCAVADLIVSVDTAAFHWGGILGRPTLGIYNVNDGAAYRTYYPTARIVQTCATPCLNTRYGTGNGTCSQHTSEALPIIPGLSLSRCYPKASVEQILEAVRGYAEPRPDHRRTGRAAPAGRETAAPAAAAPRLWA